MQALPTKPASPPPPRLPVSEPSRPCRALLALSPEEGVFNVGSSALSGNL